MTEFDLDVMHCSMQFSDKPEQQQHDARAIFDRCVKRQVRWVTGTEAGENPLQAILRKEANDHGYTFIEYKSLWIAVERAMIHRKTYAHDAYTVVDNALTVGHGHDTSLLAVHFTNDDLGKVTVLCSHYPRFGRPGAKDPEYRVNLKWNKKIADFIGSKAKEFGKGAALCFYGGDQNIPDNISDTFFGNPLTSLADELGHHESTGHGEIDVIASYNGDGRVKGKYWNPLSDKEFFLNSDHFACDGGFTVTIRGT